MSDDVVDLAQRRAAKKDGIAPDETPHLQGSAVCLGCRHRWQAVAPVGTFEFECPSCHTNMGRILNEVVRQKEPVWTCHCGNQYFLATDQGMYCPNCGTWQKGF